MTEPAEPSDPESASVRFPSAHARYQHLFVVVRLPAADALCDGARMLVTEDDVALTKAFGTEEEAEMEARRMNELNQGQWQYFVSVARLVPSATEQ